MCTYEHSKALISMRLLCHERSWLLMSAPGPMTPCSWLLLSSNECSLLHGAKFRHVLCCSRVLMSNHKHSWAPISTQKQPKEAMSDPDYPWAHITSHGHSCHGAMSTHESLRVVMSMAPWGHGNSSALMSAHGTIARFLWVLVRAHECSWVLIRAQECSWDLISGEVLHQRINTKC